MTQTKLNEMWAALTAYQPQADAAGHGESWAKMCKEKTYAASDAAASDAAADAADAYADYADYAYADYAYYAAAYAYYAAVVAAYAVDAVDAEKWAQRAIDKINKVLKLAPPQRTWVGMTDEEALDCWPGLAMYADCVKFWENIEAKLKEKNEH